MWLKTTIVMLFIAILVSLGFSAVSLLTDKGRKDRTRRALGVRAWLTILLLICVSYGIWSGQLSISAPWYR